jgi:Uma2 family endonuclease
MSALPKEKQEPYYTYADYKEWELDEGERFEIMDGEAYAMSAPNTRHQTIHRELFGQFFIFLQGKTCQLFSAPLDVRLFYAEDESDDTVVQPDIVVICDKAKIGPEGCRGAPDLVVEILSPSNTAIEMEQKRKLYHEAGVREYWVIDGENNGLNVYLFQKEVIVKTYKETDTVAVSILPGLNIALEQVFKEAAA